MLSVLRSSALVVDGSDEVLKASAPAIAMGLVKDRRIAVRELEELVQTVRRDGQIRETEIVMQRTPGLPPRHVTARVAPLNSQQVLALVAWHMLPGSWRKAQEPVSDGAFRRLARKVDMVLLARLSEADCNGRSGTFDCSFGQWFLDRALALGVEHEAPAPLLLGRHLIAMGVTPGPAMGEILRAVYEQQLDGTIVTHADAEAAARVILSAHRS